VREHGRPQPRAQRQETARQVERHAVEVNSTQLAQFAWRYRINSNGARKCWQNWR